jgi:hypothetical protein
MTNHAVAIKEGDSLILDGPNEVVKKMLTGFYDSNNEKELVAKQSAIVMNMEKRKKNLALSFIRQYTKRLKVSHDQLGEIVSSLQEKEFFVMEEQFTRLLHRKAKLYNFSALGCVGLFLASALFALLGNLFFINMAFMIFFCTGGGILPFLLLLENFYGDRSAIYVPCRPTNYLALRRYLKRKYGSQYFPYQELKNALGLGKKTVGG